MLSKQVLNTSIYKLMEFLLLCMILSVIFNGCTVTGLLSVGSAVTAIASVIFDLAYFYIISRILGETYRELNSKKSYYFSACSSYFLFVLAGILVMVFSEKIFERFFSITKSLYLLCGVSLQISFAVFCVVFLAVILCIPKICERK